jgi:hypothetical protein
MSVSRKTHPCACCGRRIRWGHWAIVHISEPRKVQTCRKLGRKATGILHRRQGLHPHKVRDDRNLTSCLEATYTSFVLDEFSEVRTRAGSMAVCA